MSGPSGHFCLTQALHYDLSACYSEGSTTCSTAHALLESDLLEFENNDELAKDLTIEPAKHAHAGANSSSGLFSDRNVNGEWPARRPQCKASILNRPLNDSTVATEQTSQQKSEVLVERECYMERIRWHDLRSYYNQDHGYFNATLFSKDNMKLFPRRVVMVARWLSRSAKSGNAETISSQSSILL